MPPAQSDVSTGPQHFGITEALFIVKWGGALTKLGRKQALNLGEEFRNSVFGGASPCWLDPLSLALSLPVVDIVGVVGGGRYRRCRCVRTKRVACVSATSPTGQPDPLAATHPHPYLPPPRAGDQFFLRIHNTYRHDLKIYSSEEGRVRTTAAAFAKGCLDLESEHLTPIMVSMVHCHRKMDYMLDNTKKAQATQREVKNKLYSFLLEEGDLTEDRIRQIVPTGHRAAMRRLREIGNVRKALDAV